MIGRLPPQTALSNSRANYKTITHPTALATLNGRKRLWANKRELDERKIICLPPSNVTRNVMYVLSLTGISPEGE